MRTNTKRNARLQLNQPTSADLLSRLGPHPATLLRLDLDAASDADLGRWLVATVLLGGRSSEEAALTGFARLRDAGLATPAAIAHAGSVEVHRQLEAASLSKSEAVAAVLTRVCTALERNHRGSIDALLADSDGLEDLARRLASLGKGFGRSAVFRFLTPLRECWTAANDLPASPAVVSAARDLGLISETQDEEGAPASLTRWLRNESRPGDVPEAAPALRDLEAALDRLGRIACLRQRTERCPLGDRCPHRKGSP